MAWRARLGERSGFLSPVSPAPLGTKEQNSPCMTTGSWGHGQGHPVHLCVCRGTHREKWDSYNCAPGTEPGDTVVEKTTMESRVVESISMDESAVN